MKLYKTFLSGIVSGILVGIGGTVYMSCDNKYVGAVLFSVALLSICYLGFYLYTGRIGYMGEKFEVTLLPHLGIGLLGNYVGATALGLIVAYARPNIVETAKSACENKLALGCPKAIILGAMCGMLMYVAVKTYKDLKTPLGILFCIPVFILCGFEHSIADMFYLALAGIFGTAKILFVIYVVLGNSIGALIIAWLWRFSQPKAN